MLHRKLLFIVVPFFFTATALGTEKEEFEPFLLQAKEKYAEGDFVASRDLCQEMLKRNSSYKPAKECVLKAKKELDRLRREAYANGVPPENIERYYPSRSR